jgi:hypothetical protein
MSIATCPSAHYALGMDLKNKVRERLDKAIRAWVAEGKGQPRRSRRQAAELAKVSYDHLSKFLVPDGPWLDIEKIAAVCTVVGVEVSWLFQDTERNTNDRSKPLPIIALSRVRAMARREDVINDILKNGGEGPSYPTNDPQAFWLDIDQKIEGYELGARAAILPGFKVLHGDLVAAITQDRATIGKYSVDGKGENVLILDGKTICYQFDILGFVDFIGKRPNSR